MSVFVYEAKDGPEKRIRGKIHARNQEEAIEKIHNLGRVPIKIAEYVSKKVPLPEVPVVQKYTAKDRDVTVFSQQLASLLKSGISIIKAINIIADQSASAGLKAILQNIAKNLSEGEAFSEALARYPGVFPTLYISMVRAGEGSGKLYEVLAKVSEYRRKAEESLSKTRTAMVYPALMGAVGIGTIIFMLVFVMPRIIRLFGGLGQNLPVPTKVVMWISALLREQWLFVLSGILIILIVSKQFSKTQLNKRLVSFLGLNLPVIKKLVRMIEFSRFSRTMSLLLKSGIPILTALKLAVPTVENDIIRGRLLKCCIDLERGGSFGRGLESSSIFPPFMVNLIIVAEESGRLDETFDEIAATYERESDEAHKALMSLLEPIMILVMGLVVGFVVIAMLLPIFELNFTAM